MAVFDYEQVSKLAPAAARQRSGESPCAACTVRDMTICAPLDSQELAQLSALMTPVELDAGAPLFDEGEAAGNVFNVTSGTIKVYKLLPDGRRQVTGFLLPGDFLGLAKQETYAFSAEAVTVSTLCRFPRHRLEALMQRLPTTVSLTAVSALIAIIVGLSAGIAAALRPRSLVDRFATLGATFGQAVPNFWFGLLLAAIFAVGLRWFPATGFTPITQSPLDWLRSVTLPALALGLASSAAIARQVRSAMVGVLQQDYIRAARAQGLSRRRVIFKHALKNALVPVVAVLSFQITVLLGGALIVEQVFAINGLGTLAITAVRRQDIPMIQGLVLVMVGLVVIVQLATDLIYGYLNPKARPS